LWHRSPASFAFSWVQSRLSTIYQFLSQHLDLRSFWASLVSCHSRVTLIDIFAILGLRNLVTCHSPHRRPIRPLPPLPPSQSASFSLLSAFAARNHTTNFSLSLRRCSLDIYRLDALRFHSLFQFSHSGLSLALFAWSRSPSHRAPRSCLVATREISSIHHLSQLEYSAIDFALALSANLRLFSSLNACDSIQTRLSISTSWIIDQTT
jgi:hypothetical protein